MTIGRAIHSSTKYKQQRTKNQSQDLLIQHQLDKEGMAVDVKEIIILLIVAGVCGSIGRAISGYSHGGCLVSIALGFIGALIGTWLARAIGLPELFPVRIGTTSFPIIWSIIGSAVFVALISLLTRSRT
jgi:uncharacterized membrane protein YeaQ/YmgE (transglycosylase-associated protein family)